MTKHKRNFNLTLILVILVALPFTIYSLIKYSPNITEGLTGLTGTKANIVVNLTDSYPFRNVPWAHLAQGGEEKEDMLAPVLGQVASLTPQYIRIDHVFDFYDVVSRSPEGQLQFNWTKLDSEIRNIRRTGAKPFISISYMPAAISSGTEIDNPRNWNEWSTCVEALVRHISGELAISDVYYEVWNEPDLFGKFSLNGEKNYLTLYKYAALGAMDVKNVQSFKFGGPATTGLYDDWVKSFISFAQLNRLRLDFYSWHRYSKSLAVYDDDILRVKTLIQPFEQYKNIELVISESGYDSENNKANDGPLSAIHTIGLYASSFQKIDRLFHFEIKDGPGPEKYWGRWGILTHEKWGSPVPKPRYLAIQFLNRMRGAWYPVYGQGTWVKAFSTTKDNTIRLLLVNYDPTGKHSERVPVSFVNIPNKSFTYRRIDFMGKTTERAVTISSTNWNIQETLGPNSAVILEIEPN
jgi:hypothetical protein